MTTGESDVRTEPIAPGVLQVTAANPSAMTLRGTNSYIIGTTDVIVIDPGPLDEDHLAGIVDRPGGAVRYVVVTHHHEDHASGARRLAELTGAPLLGPRPTGDFAPDAVLNEGDEVAVPGARLSVLATPGHSSDHLCYVLDDLETGPLLFSGDTVLGGSSTVIAAPGGDMTEYLATLRRLIARRPAIATIAPGHGQLLTDAPAALEGYLAHRLSRESQVLAALSAHEPSDPASLARSIYPDIGEGLARASTLQVWAHLRKLATEGRARSDEPDDVGGVWRVG